MNTSSTGPKATRLRLISAAWSQNSGTLARLWVDTRIRWPASRSPDRMPVIARSVLTSTPVKGSSSRMIRASCASARARNTRLRWPPDSSPIWRPAKSCIPTRSRLAATAARSAADGMRRKPIRPCRPIITTSRTETGKLQSTSSVCGT